MFAVQIRDRVDYALARRATLADLFAGRVSPLDACDAHPYLLRAAQYHGEPLDRRCPVCRREQLTQVTYAYGDELRGSSGQARRTRELPRLAEEVSAATVYLVEVCQGCSWNYLTASYVIGSAQPPAPRRSQPRQRRSARS